jgi:hypothetical protein
MRSLTGHRARHFSLSFDTSRDVRAGALRTISVPSSLIGAGCGRGRCRRRNARTAARSRIVKMPRPTPRPMGSAFVVVTVDDLPAVEVVAEEGGLNVDVLVEVGVVFV